MSTKHTWVALILTLLFQNLAFAQHAIQWQKTYGGSGFDGCSSICNATGGGYILAGYSGSTDGQVSGNHGGMDFWVVRTDDTGGVQWQKSYGGSGDDIPYYIEKDINGGYIIGGSTTSNDGDVSGNHGGMDAWILKLDDTGGIVWQKVMGSSGDDYVNDPINTTDSGYIITGGAGANDGDISGFHGGTSDVWVIKLDKTGAVQWDKVYGSNGDDYGLNGIAAPGGGYIVCGQAGGYGGNVTGYLGSGDAWILKLDDTGGIQWKHTYGGSDYELAVTVLPTADGGYLFSGVTASTDYLLTGIHGTPDQDVWVVKINSVGTVQKQRCFGGGGVEFPFNMLHAFDGTYVLAGATSSTSGMVTGLHGALDYWVINVNDTCNLIWEECLGGSHYDTAMSIIQTPDSSFVIAGATTSSNGQISFNHGAEDYWIVKLNKQQQTGVPVLNNVEGIKVFPTITNGPVNISLPQGYENAFVNVINTMGQRVATFQGNGMNRVIKLENISNGLYILQVVNNGEVRSFKVVYAP